MAMKTLYRAPEFGTPARGDRSHGDGASAAPDSLARTVSTLLWPSRAAARAADLRARAVQRQRSQIDAGDAGSGHAAGHLSSLSARARTCGALGKIANCHVAVTAALWTGTRAWLTGALLYRLKDWLSDPGSTCGGTDSRRRGVPGEMASGADVDPARACRAAADHRGACRRRVRRRDRLLPRALHRWRLPYAVGVSRYLTVFPGTPAVHVPPSGAMGRPRSQLVLADETRPIAVRALALALQARAWLRMTWRNGANRPWSARFAAVRVTPAHDWRDRRLAPEVWLLCEQDLGATPRTKYFFVNLPATTSVNSLVRLAHQRWAIEQQYQELKTELGFDHFEGRSYPGWQHHVVLSAVAYAFLQRKRTRRGVEPPLTFPGIRAIVQEIFTALLFARQPVCSANIPSAR